MRLILVILLACVLMPAVQGCGPKMVKTPRRLNRAPAPPPPVPPARQVPLDAALQQAARQEITAAAESPEPLIRAHAMEALQQTLGTEASDVIVKHLSDEAAIVRFAAAMAAGELRLSAAKEPLLVLSDDTDTSAKIGARFALHRLGDTRQSHDLEKTSRDPSDRTRGDTALVLGLLGEPTATRVLLPMLRDKNTAVRLQAAEALWRLGNDQGLGELVSASLSKFPDDQMVALLALAGPKDRRALGHVEGQLTSDYPEVSLVAARAAGMLGSDAGYGVALKYITNPVADRNDTPTAAALRRSRQHTLAALAFGAIGRPDAQEYLAPLLKDPDSDVRLTAAAALLQLKS